MSSEAWKDTGNCAECRRKDYCRKTCSANKRRMEQIIETHFVRSAKTCLLYTSASVSPRFSQFFYFFCEFHSPLKGLREGFIHAPAHARVLWKRCKKGRPSFDDLPCKDESEMPFIFNFMPQNEKMCIRDRIMDIYWKRNLLSAFNTISYYDKQRNRGARA